MGMATLIYRGRGVMMDRFSRQWDEAWRIAREDSGADTASIRYVASYCVEHDDRFNYEHDFRVVGVVGVFTVYTSEMKEAQA
jgi:hypothetical protein